jgi:hypothetical protein
MKARQGKTKSLASGNESAAAPVPGVEVSTSSGVNSTSVLEVTLPPNITDAAVPQATDKTGDTGTFL